MFIDLFLRKEEDNKSIKREMVEKFQATYSPDLLFGRSLYVHVFVWVCVFMGPALCQVLIDGLTTGRMMTQQYGRSD